MFTHLHVHTEYSLLDGLSRLEPLVERTRELGMGSLAITDHGGMYGAVEFYRIAKRMGVKPIIGCEMYVAPSSRHDRTPGDNSPYHLTVLAKNAEGYGNLVSLVTKANLEGFYYRPRVDRDLLQKHHRGLIVLSGCPSAEVPRHIAQGRMEEARTAASWYRELFPDYYFELMGHDDLSERQAINDGLVELHRQLDVPLVVTNDSHYVDKQDAHLQDILVCIHTNTNVNDESRLKMEADSYYLKSPDEMVALFPELPDAAANTQRIAEMCDLELDFSQVRMPEFKLPDGVTADEHLAQVCWEGLRRRLDHATDVERQRLTYELEVIQQTSFANYFLVVWDIARFVREKEIFFAVRGSAAASLVLFCLSVTDINPLQYRLVFERFLNVERKEMPDIDMDFQDDRREEVINYVVSKYGRDHVAQIITFGTLGARASIRDVGRALAMPYADVDRVAKLVPFRLHISLDEAIEQNEELGEAYREDDEIRRLVDTARGVEGLIRHSSTHAAAVVISKEPLVDVVPLQRPTKGDDQSVLTTQYAMAPIAALGLLKMDLLGLANLTILSQAKGLIAETRGVELILRDIPLDDSKTFELLSRGETVGVFQMEGAGMTRHIKELKPSSLGDVAAMIALYRPGPMEHIGTFIEAKHGRADPEYPHPALKNILEETYGVIVYQDQVLLIAQTFAGYTLGEADIVRKAMGKKVPEIMAQERQKFIEGALTEGYSKELAEKVFALIEPFAGYAFNKAHSVSYGLISYWTAYLKANYTAEYMVALLNSYMDNTEKIAGAIVECRRLKIQVLPPDISSGDTEFSIAPAEDGRQKISFGLAAVKNVGTAAVLPVIQARKKEGPFQSIEQMSRAADMSSLNRKTLESLIKVGALDAFGDRGALLAVVDRILALAQSDAKLRDSDQTTMFDLFGETVPTPLARIDLPEVQTTDSVKRAWEVELLGLAISGGNALDSLVLNGDSETVVFRSQLEAEMAGKSVVLAGQVSAVTERYTRNQRPFCITTLDMMDGAVEVFVWEDTLGETRGLWEVGRLVMVVGTVRVREDQISISCSQASEYSVDGEPVSAADGSRERPSDGAQKMSPTPSQDVRPSQPQPEPAPPVSQNRRRLNLRIRETGQPAHDQALLEDVTRLLMDHGGKDEVSLEIATDGRVVRLEWPAVEVEAGEELEKKLRDLLAEAGGQVSVESAAS